MLRDDMEKSKAEKSNREWMGSVYGWSWEFSLLSNSEQSATLNVDHFSLILASSEVCSLSGQIERESIPGRTNGSLKVCLRNLSQLDLWI